MPLLAACQDGRVDRVKHLLQAGADPCAGIKADNMSPLYKACERGHAEIARLHRISKQHALDKRVAQVSQNNKMTRLQTQVENLTSCIAHLKQQRSMTDASPDNVGSGGGGG